MTANMEELHFPVAGNLIVGAICFEFHDTPSTNRNQSRKQSASESIHQNKQQQYSSNRSINSTVRKSSTRKHSARVKISGGKSLSRSQKANSTSVDKQSTIELKHMGVDYSYDEDAREVLKNRTSNTQNTGIKYRLISHAIQCAHHVFGKHPIVFAGKDKNIKKALSQCHFQQKASSGFCLSSNKKCKVLAYGD